MKKIIFLTATAALLILVASCGQNAQNRQPAEEPQQETVQAMDDEQFAVLIKEIFYNLPETVMPNPLKTEKQRKNVVYGTEEDTECVNIAPYCLWYSIYDEGGHEQWEMAHYLTDDRQNVVLIIQDIAGYAEAYELMFRKTLNYNIETKEFTEIELPMEPFTTEELFQEINIADIKIENKAKKYFNREQEVFYTFNEDGFSASVSLSMFWFSSEEEGIFEYHEEHHDEFYPEDRQPAYRKWDGNQFVKANK
jgi:hypothetical protein